MLHTTKIEPTYQSPLGTRYASETMKHIFALHTKYSTWRMVWVALAQAEMELGLPITQEQLDQLKKHIDTIDFAKAEHYERQLKHDVMAHVHAYGDQCPKARGIIHLGATSCTVTDNADIIIIRDALRATRDKLVVVIKQLAQLADQYKDLPCLAYTHFQSAQPTTVGKRFCLWLQELLLDLHDLEYRINNLKFLGIKGATGTQASFLSLFNGDHKKVEQLEQRIAQLLGFKNVFGVSGQTYTRKQDAQVLQVLSGIAISAHKMATDLRLLAHLKEVEEPFGKKQIGSSAMPYKRNPMMSERACSLARYVMSLAQNPTYTAAIQWFERTLDDSANRRLCIPESFLALDGVLNLLLKITDDLVVYPAIIKKRLTSELPFMATEDILMACVKQGGDRQIIHERLRQHSVTVATQIKNGGTNNLIEILTSDDQIPLNKEQLEQLLRVDQFIGRAPEQVAAFLYNEVQPVLDRYKNIEVQAEVKY